MKKGSPMERNFPSVFRDKDDTKKVTINYDSVEDVDSLYTEKNGSVYKRDHGRINLPDTDVNYQSWKQRQDQDKNQKREKAVETEEKTDIQNF